MSAAAPLAPPPPLLPQQPAAPQAAPNQQQQQQQRQMVNSIASSILSALLIPIGTGLGLSLAWCGLISVIGFTVPGSAVALTIKVMLCCGIFAGITTAAAEVFGIGLH